MKLMVLFRQFLQSEIWSQLDLKENIIHFVKKSLNSLQMENMNIQMVDLKGQYQKIKKQVNESITK